MTKILVIDDEAPLRLMWRVNLEAHGMEVVEAADGLAGLEKAQRELPDLILLDVMMPGLDGWQVAEQLRDVPVTREIPVVFLTPRAKYRDRRRGLELGAVDYITLPCNPLELAPRIEELLKLGQSERNELRREKLEEVKALMQRDPGGPEPARADTGAPGLSAELFEADSKHEAYWSAVTDVLRHADRQAIPDIARQMSLNHLQHMLSLQGIGSFEAWVRDLAESFSDGYILASAEEWELEPATAKELIDECMVAVNRGRLAVGSDAITATDPSTWLSLILLGLNSDLDEWEPLNAYVRSQGAWERLEWTLPTYLTVGEHIAQPRAEEIESWRMANQLAWRDGIFLALLHQFGLVSTEPGKRAFGEGDRPLSGTLFELDPQQYQLTAAQLTQATAQAVPDVAKQLHSQLIGPFVDRKLADQYGKWLGDTFECGYVLCVSETWDGLDPDTLRSLIDEGLRRVIAEKDTRDPALLINDPEYRIRNVSYGIMGDMPYFAQLGDYLGEQPAFLRIGGFGQMVLANVSSSGGIKRRHASRLQSPLYMSFMLGVSIGLLDQLGEVPPTPPPRLNPHS